MKHRRTLIACALSSLVGLVAASLLAPGLAERIALAEWAQALAEVAGAGACAAAALHTRGLARVVWALFAAGQATWALTDAVYGAILVIGHDVPEVSLLDVGWLGFYAPMLAAVVLLYRRLRPERGWQGFLDGLIVTLALAASAWTTLVGPAAASGAGGVTGTIVGALYPVLDLTCLAALGWIVLRHGRRTPPWLRWVVAAFALQSTAALAYLASTLHGHDFALAAATAFVAAGWCWVAAGLSRRSAAERAWRAGTHDAPPVWSQTAPFVLGTGLVALGCLVPHPELRIAAAAAAVVLAARTLETLRVGRGLIAERDRLVVTDPLTGVYNRRFLTRESSRAIALAGRIDEPLSVIAIDLDHFKDVNDRLGHGVGDEMLCAVAAAMASHLRLGDLLCRVGGDEFVVLCPATATAEATGVAERMRTCVQRAAALTVPEIPVTASLGVATFPFDAGDPDELLRRADAALYAAKGGGRNAVAAHSRLLEAIPD